MKSKVVSLFSVTVLIISLFAFLPQSKASAVENNEGNDYPIVLVHGLGGWGEGEFLGYNYWGGLKDVPAYLENLGHETFVASVSPVASNYDRSVELYYYIKGGTVDYGAAHANQHGHERFGRTYEGVYPEWDADHPVHLVGHSMGGLTTRGLVDLLVDGSQEEREYHQAHPEEEMSSLFEGDKSWVHSVTSIATPHNGSTYADDENRIISLVKDLVISVGAVSGIAEENIVYDFKLDHWGIRREPGESFNSYLSKVINSKVWESTDISAYDLSTPGAVVLNEKVETKSDVYYFSYTGQTSKKELLTGYHIPSVYTLPFLYQPTSFLGKFKRTNPNDGPIIDKTWWPNDGLVSTVSSFYPFEQPAKAYNGVPEKGKWNYYPIKSNWDHMDFIGILSLSSKTKAFDVYPLYKEIAENVHSLEE